MDKYSWNNLNQNYFLVLKLTGMEQDLQNTQIRNLLADLESQQIR